MKWLRFFFFILMASSVYAQEDCLSVLEKEWECPDLMRDLAIIHCCEEQMNKKLPVHQGFYGQVGYFAMPSARMRKVGDVTFGYSSVKPYYNYFLGFQLFERLELTGAYRVFRGVQDVLLSQHGFGDFSDKGVDFKLAIVQPEDTDYMFPGLAFGWIDFLGSSRFDTKYLVATQVFQKWGIDLSLGYRWGNVSKGLFGGVSWMPWWDSCDPFLRGVAFCAEYDPTDFKKDPHPDCQEQNGHINVGLKYLLGDYGNLFISSTRGREVAMGLSLNFGLGSTTGLLPKIEDPMPYQSPINWQKLCALRPSEELSQELAFAMREQGFLLMQSLIERCPDTGCLTLRLEVVNQQWRYERVVHMRLTHLMAFLTPENVDQAIVVVRTDGMPIQEYRFRREDLMRFACGCMCDPELAVLSPLREVTCPPRDCFNAIAYKNLEEDINVSIGPRFRSFFGSSRGKFKIGGDLVASFQGLLWDTLYYRTTLRYTVFTQMDDVGDKDMLNPSQLLNVNSDRIRYYQTAQVYLEDAYLQRNWNLGRGFYGQLTGGLFDVAYGGVAAEGLYYPVNSCWAIGVDGAVVRKRTYNGLGFTNKIRRLVGHQPTYVPYTVLTQCFLDFYYDIRPMDIQLKLSAGQFLARDIGVRTELTRYFANGMKMGIWLTYTNGHDKVNGSTYYDKGFMISVPLDFFLLKSSKARWDYGMAAWLRDVGYRTWTGDTLFKMINAERQ